jgi:hypothetical protein
MAVKLSALRAGKRKKKKKKKERKKEKKNGLRCACHLWEMTLNYGLGASLDNMQNLKGMRGKAGEANSTTFM